MESGKKIIITPGGTPLQGNPLNPLGLAEPHSDSGGGSLTLVPTPAVGHLAAGLAPNTSEKGTASRKGSLGGISSQLEDMEIGEVTDGDSVGGGTTGSIDSDTEYDLLNPGDAGKKKKKVSEAQKLSKALRNAKTYLKKMSLKKNEDLTEKEKELIRFNEAKLAKLEADRRQKLETIAEEKKPPAPKKRTKLQRSEATDKSPKPTGSGLPPSARKTAKRDRSGDGEENVAKKAKPSLSFDVPEDCQIAVIDQSDLDGRMTSERWMEVEARVLLAIAELDSDSCGGISFDGAGWQKGVKVVGCGNRRSRDFLEQVIRGCGELWQGAKLEVVPMSQLPLRKKVTLWIPPPVPEKDETVLKILGNQNRDLRTQEWRMISSNKSQNGKGKEFVFTIDEESLGALRRSAGSIKFGLGTLKLRLPNDPSGESSGAKGGSD